MFIAQESHRTNKYTPWGKKAEQIVLNLAVNPLNTRL